MGRPWCAMLSALGIRKAECQDAGIYTDADRLAGRGTEPQIHDSFADKLQRDWLVPVGVDSVTAYHRSIQNIHPNSFSCLNQQIIRTGGPEGAQSGWCWFLSQLVIQRLIVGCSSLLAAPCRTVPRACKCRCCLTNR